MASETPGIGDQETRGVGDQGNQGTIFVDPLNPCFLMLIPKKNLQETKQTQQSKQSLSGNKKDTRRMGKSMSKSSICASMGAVVVGGRERAF